MGFQKGAVAFLDILGFKSIVEDAETQSSAFSKLTSLIEVVESHMRWDNKLLSAEVPIDVQPKYLFISDTIIISAPLNIDGYDGLVTVTLKAIAIAHKLLEMGLLVRGGISVGNVWNQPTNIFGTGYIAAYLAEQEADHPRILLTSEASLHISTALQKGVDLRTLGLWMYGTDGTIADTLNPHFIRGLETYGRQESAFQQYLSHIVTNLERLQPGSIARGKWEWMAEFFNQAIVRHSINVQPIKSFPFPCSNQRA
jgi:hypothetical protein